MNANTGRPNLTLDRPTGHHAWTNSNQWIKNSCVRATSLLCGLDSDGQLYASPRADRTGGALSGRRPARGGRRLEAYVDRGVEVPRVSFP